MSSHNNSKVVSFEFDLELMFTAIEHRPCLWDRSTEGYKHREKTQAAWREVCRVVRDDFDYFTEDEKAAFVKEVIKKWNNVRDCHRRHMRQMKERGSGAPTGKKYLHSDSLQFLDKVYDDLNWQSAYIKEDESNGSNGALGQTSGGDDGGSDIAVDPLWETTTTAAVHHPSSRASPVPLSRKRSRKMMFEGSEKAIGRQFVDDRDNPHISFCKSYMPFLSEFSQDEVIDFQMGVLQLIRDIKNKH